MVHNVLAVLRFHVMIYSFSNMDSTVYMLSHIIYYEKSCQDLRLTSVEEANLLNQNEVAGGIYYIVVAHPQG